MIFKGLLVSLIMIGIMLALSIWAMGQLPAGEQFATHWDANGVANGFSGRATVLWMMPGMTIGIALLLAIVPQLDPRKRNLLRSSMAYLVIWVGTLLVLAFAHFMMVLNATGTINMADVGNGPGMIKALTIILGGFFAAIGAVMGKIRPNWFMGIRTPWTLSSDLSWDKTHRLTGWLFLATGLLSIISAFIMPPNIAMGILITGSLATLLIAVIYSWYVWKNDPVRETLVPEDTK
ncbi:MAG: SdpI family protein [Robiginitomaculum sp.]|nr:SdpI family protein [Robiginitomaculum sp.]